MIKDKKVPPHDDKLFFQGLALYYTADIISKSDSWENMLEKIDRLPQPNEIKSLLFGRFQVINFVTPIEYKLCSLCEHLYKKKLFKKDSKAKSHVIKQIKRFRRLHTNEAVDLLANETKGIQKRIWTPHKLLFVAGYSLGNFIDLIRSHTKNFQGKEKLLLNLSDINEKRNLIVHNFTSSRIEMRTEIKKFVEIANECLELLKNLLADKDVRNRL